MLRSIAIRRPVIVAVALIVVFGALFTRVAVTEATVSPVGPACRECVVIRVGLPHVVRGPESHDLDAKFSEIALPDGRFRGFPASGSTYAVDGATPSDMGGPLVTVLRPGAPGAYDSCGRWIQHVERAGPRLIALVHNETMCDYRIGQTRKSMSFATSTDDGLSWTDYGRILTGADPPTPRANTGEGDCDGLAGGDGYWYAYCSRPGVHATVVARAPIDDPMPGRWRHYYDGTWTSPGLGGAATSLPCGSSVARWTVTGETLALGKTTHGFGLCFSADHVTFEEMREPLLVLDRQIWNRPNPAEIVAYAVLLDARDGSNEIGTSANLVYTYLQPNETFARRYLVFRPVSIARSPVPITPQVAVLLARWYDAALRDRWSTTAPVPGDGVSYRLDARLGYLMTAPDATKPSVALDDCVSERPGHPDHLLERFATCGATRYARLRTAGWVYTDPQPNTVPLYRCYDEADRSHLVSNHADCEGLGKPERLLGYALAS